MVGRPGKYQPRFTSGQLDPLMSGNTDEADYRKGASLMVNVRPFPQGGFGNIWGTVLLGQAKPGIGGALSNVKIRSFTHSRAASYDLLFTDQNADVYGKAGYLASIATPWANFVIPQMKTTQQIDTMICCHQSLQPYNILRQGSDTSWSLIPTPLINIPNYDYGAVYTNGVASVWTLAFFNISAGNHYTISVNGVASAAIAYTGVAATDGANILAAIQNNVGANVGPGVTLTQGGSTTPGGTPIPSGSFGIEFDGTANQGNGWSVSGAVVDNASAAITASQLTLGVDGGEPIMSAARGWPGACLIYSARLLLGVFQGVPNAILFSQASDYWNLNTQLTTASAPFLAPLDMYGAATITALHQGRTLLAFSDAGEYWMSSTGIDKTNAPTIVFSTKYGIAPTVDPVESEARTLFVDATGGVLREYKFDYAEQNYTAQPVSMRAGSLISGIVDLAKREPQGSTDLETIYAVRSDGAVGAGFFLRSEDITAFTQRVTPGKFLAANVNDRFEASFAVQRTVAGAQIIQYEREVAGQLLDCSVAFAFATPQTLVTGLDQLEGAQVWAIADNVPQGPFTVASGAITLNVAASAGYVGLWTPPNVVTMPVPRDVGPNTVVRRPCRVHTVRLRLVGTSSVAVGANGLTPFDVPLTTYNGQTAPLLVEPFTGEIAIEGLQGYSTDGLVQITQLTPGLLNVVGVTVEVDL